MAVDEEERAIKLRAQCREGLAGVLLALAVGMASCAGGKGAAPDTADARVAEVRTRFGLPAAASSVPRSTGRPATVTLPPRAGLSGAIGSAELFEGAIGDLCSTFIECRSGICADGRCCDTACIEGCDRCDLPGAIGTCTRAAPASSRRINAAPAARGGSRRRCRRHRRDRSLLRGCRAPP